jgi:hypothetical protein
MGTVWTVGVNIYPKTNELLLPFAPTNICSFGCLDEWANVDVDEREGGAHHKFAPICYLLGVNRIRGQNICPTTFTPHIWHIKGKLGVNLPYLHHLLHHPNRAMVRMEMDLIRSGYHHLKHFNCDIIIRDTFFPNMNRN